MSMTQSEAVRVLGAHGDAADLSSDVIEAIGLALDALMRELKQQQGRCRCVLCVSHDNQPEPPKAEQS